VCSPLAVYKGGRSLLAHTCRFNAEAAEGETVPCGKAKAAAGTVDRQETTIESGSTPNDALPRSSEIAD